jgi:hypothetical protein
LLIKYEYSIVVVNKLLNYQPRLYGKYKAVSTHTYGYYPVKPKIQNNIAMAMIKPITTHIHKYYPIGNKIP